MEHNFQHLDYSKMKSISTQNRKRVHTSGRQSPRELFGNLKLKKSIQEEDDTTCRDLNNSKTGCGWKPPLKKDINNSNNNPCSSFNACHKDSLNKSSQNNVAISPSMHPFDIDEENYSDPTETLGFKEQYISGENGESDEESFTGNFEETISNREYTNQNDIQNVPNLNFQDDLLSHNVSFDNSINNDNSEDFEKNRDIGINKITSEQVNGNENSLLKLLVEKQELIDTDKDCLINNFHNSNLQNIDDSMHNLSQDMRIQCNETSLLQDYTDIEEYNQFEENELSENSDASKSTVKLNVDLKNFMMEQGNARKNGPQYEIKYDCNKEKIKERRKESFECQVSKQDTEDSFGSVITNSEFLQFESQGEKSMDMKISCNSELSKSIDTITRFTSSLKTQNEWQKNILKSIMKDVNELNKAVVNATASLKSLRRDDNPAK